MSEIDTSHLIVASHLLERSLEQHPADVQHRHRDFERPNEINIVFDDDHAQMVGKRQLADKLSV